MAREGRDSRLATLPARTLAVVLVALGTLAVAAGTAHAAFTTLAGPFALGAKNDGTLRDFPHQVGMAKGEDGSTHIVFHRRGASPSLNRLAYTMLGPAGNTLIAPTELTTDETWEGPVNLGVTHGGKVFVVFNEAWFAPSDGQVHYMLLDPQSHPRNGTPATMTAPFVAIPNTVLTTGPVHNHNPVLDVDAQGRIHLLYWEGSCCRDEPGQAAALRYARFSPAGHLQIGPKRIHGPPAATPYLGQSTSISVGADGKVHASFEGAVQPHVTYQTLANPTRLVIDWFAGRRSPFDGRWPTHNQLVLLPDGTFRVNLIDSRGAERDVKNQPARAFVGINHGDGVRATAAAEGGETSVKPGTQQSFHFTYDPVGDKYDFAEVPFARETLTNPNVLPDLTYDRNRAEALSLPFSFPFYDEGPHNTIWVSNRGYIAFVEPASLTSTGSTWPTSALSRQRVIGSLWIDQASSFQGGGYTMLDGETGNTLIAPSAYPRGDWMHRWPLVDGGRDGGVDLVFQLKGPSPDVENGTRPEASEIWHQRFDPSRHPQDGTPITNWGAMRTVNPHPLSLGDGGTSRHPSIASDPSGKLFVAYMRNDGSSGQFNCCGRSGEAVMLVALDPRTGTITDPPQAIHDQVANLFHMRVGIAASSGSARADLSWPREVRDTSVEPPVSGADGILYRALSTSALAPDPTALAPEDSDPEEVPAEPDPPTTGILGKKLKLNRKGVTRVRLACRADDAAASDPCEGTLVLRTRSKVRFKGKKRRVILARSKFSIAAGDTKRVRLKLKKRQHRLVRRNKRARRITAIARGAQPRVTKNMRLVPAKPKKRRR